MDLKAFFENEVKPALGCTEPGAVAYAASAAAAYLESPAESIHLRLSANIFKNGLNAGIPGASGSKGNLLAAALGALAGKPGKGLQALSEATAEDLKKAEDLVARGKATQEVVTDVPAVYVEAEITGGNHTVTGVISERHDLLVEVRRDGRVMRESGESGTSHHRRPPYIQDLVRQNMRSLWELAGKIDSEIEAFLLAGVKMNFETADLGLKNPWGMGVGFGLKANAPGNDLLWDIKMVSAAAADVRMAGGLLPVMSSAGSGNHGITAILPPAVAARAWKKQGRALAEAVALSHLLTGYIKAHTGLLSPVCGCAVAAGMGAAAAIVRLGGGNPDQGRVAASSLLGSTLGMVCDGAKGSCALKVSAAAGEAYVSAMMALAGYGASEDEGIISLSLPKTAKSIETLCKIGMPNVDSTILKLLQEG